MTWSFHSVWVSGREIVMAENSLYQRALGIKNKNQSESLWTNNKKIWFLYFWVTSSSVPAACHICLRGLLSIQQGAMWPTRKGPGVRFCLSEAGWPWASVSAAVNSKLLAAQAEWLGYDWYADTALHFDKSTLDLICYQCICTRSLKWQATPQAFLAFKK